MKEIDIIGCRDVRGGRPFRGLCAEQALNYFPVLKALGCPTEILKARWGPDENMWHEDLWYGYGIHEVLPTSLECLKLYVYDDWSINGWAPDLSSLFERKGLKFRELRKIWVEYWVAGDGIVDDPQPEAVEAIVHRIEQLIIEAEKAGIDMEVRVDERRKTSLE